jgi:hypothetical protein
MPNRVLTALGLPAAVVAGLLAMALGCLWLQDSFLFQRALFDTATVLRNDTAFAWELEQDGELLALERHGMDDLRFAAGELRAVAANDDPYFWLNLRGRVIDARVYTRLRVRLFSSAPSTLQFHHHALDDGRRVYATLDIPVQAGWQSVEVDLGQRQWELVPPSDSAVPRWGGRQQIVSGVRLDPVTDSGIEFAVARVEFLPRQDLPASRVTADSLRESLVEIDLFAADWNAVRTRLAESRGTPTLVVDRTAWRLPQLTLWLREQLQALAPEAIFFPRSIAADDILSRAESSSRDIVDPLSVWRAILFWITALALAAALAILYHARKLSLQLGASAELSLILVFSCLLWLLTAQSLDWLFMVNAAGFLLICALLFASRSGSWLQRLALTRPTRPEIAASAAVTVPIAILMVWLSDYAGQLGSTDWSRLLQGFVIYPLWGIVQQIYLGPVLTGLLLASVGSGARQLRHTPLWVAVAAGFLFALAHAPNFALMSATFPIGIVWSTLYQRYGSIVPLAISHGILGSLFRELAPGQLQMNGSVGFVHYEWLWF